MGFAGEQEILFIVKSFLRHWESKQGGVRTPGCGCSFPQIHSLSRVCVCVCVCARARMCVYVCVCVSSSVVSNSETPWTVAHQAPLSMEFSRIRILEWGAISFSRGSSQPRYWTQVSCIAGRFFTVWATREAQSQPCTTATLPLETPISIFVLIFFLLPQRLIFLFFFFALETESSYLFSISSMSFLRRQSNQCFRQRIAKKIPNRIEVAN